MVAKHSAIQSRVTQCGTDCCPVLTKCDGEPDSGVERLAHRAPQELVVEGGAHPGEEAQVEQTRIMT